MNFSDEFLEFCRWFKHDEWSKWWVHLVQLGLNHFKNDFRIMAKIYTKYIYYRGQAVVYPTAGGRGIKQSLFSVSTNNVTKKKQQSRDE